MNATIKPGSAIPANTILAVEDEPAERSLVVRRLRELGYRVLEAGSGPEALAIWSQFPDGIDLLFTDIIMPEGMTGWDLGKTLLAKKPDLKIIYTSGYNIVKNDFAARNKITFLQKPYPLEVLTKTIQSLIGISSAAPEME
jgi:two-component system cell cycle sensor histidine kinase/response regulator CckA